MDAWNSRRSPILSVSGIAASSQPLASACGAKILEAGGTAADAAVAMAACCNVLEPCSTGIGGDAFALYFDSKTSKVTCLLGNGATSENLSLNVLASRGIGIQPGQKPLDPVSGLCVNVPGAASLWETLVQKHGKLSLRQVLNPAINMAEQGFPIAPITAFHWATGYLQGDEAHRVFRTRPDGYPVNKAYPSTGDVIRNADLGRTLRSLADHGAKAGFYNNYIGEAIVDACREYGGVLSAADLDAHVTRCVAPIRCKYKGKWIYECPPPTHGLAALLALNQLEELEKRKERREEKNWDSNIHSGTSFEGQEKDDPTATAPAPEVAAVVQQTHMELEVMRRAFVDALQFVGDISDGSSEMTASAAAMLAELLSCEHAARRVADLNSEHISIDLLAEAQAHAPAPQQQQGRSEMDTTAAYKQSDTVYFCVVDKDGNGCSFINSNYMGFGTGIVPKGCGFTLHNRGYNFSLDPNHINSLGPRKYCYHTIIPALLTSIKDPTSSNPSPGEEQEQEEELFATVGVMGGFMQPQGHVQVIRHLLEGGLDPQEALDRPRWQLIQVDNSNEGLVDLSTSSHVIIEAGYGEAAATAAATASATATPLVAGDAAGYFSTGRSCDNDDALSDTTSIMSTADLVQRLTAMGHDVKVVANTAGRLVFGKGQIIVRNPVSGCLIAGSDPRSDGCAIPAII